MIMPSPATAAMGAMLELRFTKNTSRAHHPPFPKWVVLLFSDLSAAHEFTCKNIWRTEAQPKFTVYILTATQVFSQWK